MCTAHIALTLAAGVIPNVLFCGSYTLLLSRTQAPMAPEAALLPVTTEGTAHEEPT